MAEVVAQEQKVVKKKEPFFGKKERKLISDPFNDSNPITVQVLGICSALAVTVQLKPSVVMAISVIFVMIFSSLIISLMRNLIPSRVRIIVQLVVVAAMVILVDQILKAYLYDVSKQLSVFVGLIITNCIVMGRLEAFALGNKPFPAVVDAFGNGLGYGVILVIVSFFRELFGSGTLSFPGLGSILPVSVMKNGDPASDALQVIPQAFYDAGYENNGLMILPPMALIVVGIIIWVQRSRNKKLIEEN